MTNKRMCSRPFHSTFLYYCDIAVPMFDFVLHLLDIVHSCKASVRLFACLISKFSQHDMPIHNLYGQFCVVRFRFGTDVKKGAGVA